MTAIEEAQTTPHLNNQRKKDQIMKTFKATLIAMVMISALGLAQPVTANAQDSQTTSLVGKGGLCLDVPYADASNGTDLWMWDCNQSEAQSFTYDAAAKELRVLGKCLDIEGRERSGSDVQITLCGYTGNLNWYATVQGEIRTEKFPDLCLDIRGGKATRKTAVQMWTCNGTAAQRWNLDTDTAVADSPADEPASGTATFDKIVNEGMRKQKVIGEITVNGTTYDYRSGGFGRGSLPPGDYTVTKHRNFRTGTSFSVPDGNGDGQRFGYSFALNDAYDSRVGDTRTLLRIHPDGGKAGTAGCIGIIGDETEQRRFRTDMNAELNRNGGSYTLSVG